MLPADTLIRLHVTSLDVVHSFWAYQLGVKADANPGVDNVVYLQLKGPRTFHIRCAELCGLWHGYMFDTGDVVPAGRSSARGSRQQRALPAGLASTCRPTRPPTSPSPSTAPDEPRGPPPCSPPRRSGGA